MDDHWHVPHFEKMAADNATLLGLYCNAYALTGEHRFCKVAQQTLAWIADCLWDKSGRGFFASQDADARPGDDGDYFTWTQEEVRAALTDETAAILAWHNIDPSGNMPHRPGRNVLDTRRAPR